jgi:hypothetical protein
VLRVAQQFEETDPDSMMDEQGLIGDQNAVERSDEIQSVGGGDGDEGATSGLDEDFKPQSSELSLASIEPFENTPR